MKIKTSYRLLTSSLVLGALALTAHGAVVDDFSADSSADYNDFYAFNQDANPTGNYARSGNTFQPTTPRNSTEYFIRNTGQTLGAGDSVSVDYLAATSFDAAGLAFSASATSASDNTEVLIFDQDMNFSLDTHNNFASSHDDPWTLSITRGTGADIGVLSYSLTDLAGNDFSSPLTGTYNLLSPNSTYYFGLAVYGGSEGNPGDLYPATLDNLGYTPAAAPEPSTYILLAFGFMGLAWLRRIRASTPDKFFRCGL